MNAKQSFNNLYTDISNNISAAMEEVSTLDVEHQDGKQAIADILGQLKKIHDRFNVELKTLNDHAEWDKFTISFFGETNAGKSTIIESLRILFKEEQRQNLLNENLGNLDEYEKSVFLHATKIREKLNSIYVDYIGEIQEIKNNTTKLSKILQSESAARTKRKMWKFAIIGCLMGAVTATAIILLGR